jgi:hypothetical protein
MHCRWPALALLLAIFLSAGQASIAEDVRYPFAFKIEGVGKKEVAFKGSIEVDGVSRTFDNQRTPYEFQCEATKSLVGSFEAIEPGVRIRFRAYFPTASTKKARAKVKGTRIHLKLVGKPGRQRLSTWSEDP